MAEPEGVGLRGRARRDVPAGGLASAGIALLTGIVVAVVAVSFTIWAAGGAALARFVDDERRRRVVNLLLAALIVASVALLWI